MYHIIVRVCLMVMLPVLSLFVGGCAEKDSVRVDMNIVEYETDSASVYAEVPKFSMMQDKLLEEELNDDYDEEINSMLVAFDSSDDEGDLVMGNKRVFEVYNKVKYNDNYFVSILCDTYEYRGGAHGISVWSAKNVDLQKGKAVLLADLFEDGYKDTLERLIREEMEEAPQNYSDLWEKPTIKEENQVDYYLSEKGITVFYQPYDLSYYARGMVEFEFEWEDLKSYLKEEYKKFAGEVKP